MAPTNIHLIDDAIVALGKPFAQYDARELAVHNGMFILTFALPIVGAWSILLTRDGWWKKGQRLSLQTVGAAWLVSVMAFGVMVHLQRGVTTRSTFVLAVLHEMIEVLLDCVLLGFTARRAFAYVWLFGLVLLLGVIALPTMAHVFVVAAIIGGGNDLLIALLFLYAKQWWFGVAALAHVASAIIVFAQAIRNMGVVPFNVVTFISLWAHVGFVVVAFMKQEAKYHDYEGGFMNPLDGLAPKRWTLAKLVGLGVVGSTFVTIFLSYIWPVWPAY